MLTIHLICIGKLKEAYLREAQAEYQKRLSGYCKFDLIELPEHRLSENPSAAEIARGLENEGGDILAKCRGYVTALCIEGKTLSSEELAKKLMELAVSGVSELTFVIGSSYGLSEQVKQKAGLRLSMSPMTFPHQLARVMLLEQLYRACSINANGKYHK